MDGKIPHNVPHAAERCEFPFGSMTQARVIHRKENTLGLTGGSTSSRPATDGVFARPSTSSFIGPPPPYPAQPPPPAPPPLQPPSPQVPPPQIQSPQIQSPQMAAPQSPAAPSPAPPTVAMSSPLLVNLLQNDAPAPQPRAKPPHPAKLDRLEDGQVELAVGRAPFEYRARTQPRPPPSPAPPPPPSPRPTRLTPFIRRTFPARPSPPVQYRPPVPNATVVSRPRFPQYAESFAPPPPYRQTRPRPPAPRVSPEDLQALLPPSTTMDQKTQSSFQEFQRYQQQYIARQRAASRASQPAESGTWNEPYRDLGLTLSDLPDSCDLDQLLPTLGADLNLDDISDLDGAKLDFYDQPSTSDAPDQMLRDITGQINSQTNGPSSSYEQPAVDVPSKRDFDESSFMPPPPVPPQPKLAPPSPAASTSTPPFKSPPNACYSPNPGPSTSAERNAHPGAMVQTSIAHNSIAQASIAQSTLPQTSTIAQTSLPQMASIAQTASCQPSLQSSMPPPSKVPMRPSLSVSTATVGSQASQQEIEEQSKQYLIKTLMRDDDPPPAPPKEEKKPEEVTVANCNLEENVANAIKEVAKEIPTPMPEIFGIAKSIPEENLKREDDKPKNRLLKKDDKSLAQKGGKPRATGAKEKPSTLKDRIVRDGKSTKVALPRLPGTRPAATEPEKESIKLRLKLEKNEPITQPVYKADVSFVNQQKGDKPIDGELRVPPLHISLRGRNSAVIKNSKKGKKKLSPGEIHSKKFKIRKTLETDDNTHRRESGESVASKSGENETEEYLNAKEVIGLDFYTEGDAINEIAGDNNVVYRMKTISKNAHIVTKHDYKLNNRVQALDLKVKKKLKILSDVKPEKERDREWRNDTLDKEGKYAQNEGYRELNNHDAKKKLPSKVDNGANCDSKTDGAVQSDGDSEKSGASEVDSRLLKCHKDLEWTLGDEADRRNSDDIKRTIAESAITSPNGLLSTEKKRKTSHSSCPDPGVVVVGSTNVGTIAGLAESPPGASSQRGGASPRRKERPKDKSYCKLVAERAAEFGARSPAASAQGEDSGIESMDALSEKSPNQASQSPPGPARKERLDMPRSTSPGSVQRIIGVAPPPSDELLERLARAAAPPRLSLLDAPPPRLHHLGDIEAELAKMHAEHDTRRRPATPILREPSPPPAGADSAGHFDPPPTRNSPPLYTYSNQEKTPVDEIKEERAPPAENGEITQPPVPEPLERLPMKADFPDKSLLEQLLIEIPTPDYAKRPESPSPSLERVARSSVRTRSSSKLSSPADGPRTPRLSPGLKTERADSPAQKNCIRADEKTSPRAVAAPAAVTPNAVNAAPTPAKPAPGAKRKRRESESSCASTISCEEGVSPGRPKKKPRWPEGARPAPNAQGKGKKDSDSDSDEPLICKVRGKTKSVKPPAGGKVVKGEGVGTRRSVRHGPAPPPPAPPNNNAPVRRKTRSAVGEGGAAAGAVRRRRTSRDGK